MRRVFLSFVILFSSLAFSQYDNTEEDYIDYDDIINRLSSSRTTYNKLQGDPFDSIRIHIAVGFVNTVNNIKIVNETYRPSFNGVQMNLGIDLFSYNWRAEGSIRNFSNLKQDTIDYKYQEFDLKLIYHQHLNKSWAYYIGGGLSARYLETSYYIEQGVNTSSKPSQSPSSTSNLEHIKLKSTTPASILVSGISFVITNSFSLDTEVSYRTAVIQDTIDKSGIDLSFKFSGHF